MSTIPGPQRASDEPSGVEHPAGEGRTPSVTWDASPLGAAGIGRDAAELEATIGARVAACDERARALVGVADGIEGVIESSRTVDEAGRAAAAKVAQARAALARIATGVEGALQALRRVATAAQEIGQVAHQTRLVAFSASVEAKRGGNGTHGFAVVAEAVTDLAAKIEQSSTLIANTVSRLDEDVSELAVELSEEDVLRERSRLRLALAQAEEHVIGVSRSARHSLLVCTAAAGRMRALASHASEDARALDRARQTARRVLDASVYLGELVPAGVLETEDAHRVAAGLERAESLASALADALHSGAVTRDALFGEVDAADAGANAGAGAGPSPAESPVEGVVRPVLVALLRDVPGAIGCEAIDFGGVVAAERVEGDGPADDSGAGDVAAGSRRAIPADALALAAACDGHRFLLQTRLRPSSGQEGRIAKVLYVPVRVDGRYWGALRLEYLG